MFFFFFFCDVGFYRLLLIICVNIYATHESFGCECLCICFVHILLTRPCNLFHLKQERVNPYTIDVVVRSFSGSGVCNGDGLPGHMKAA